jgi:metal-responsive CopG/Arc/MetJ family transcriptional regulator
MAKEKLQITMESELLNDVDDYCAKNYMSRSQLISHACLQVVNQQKLIDSISTLSLAIKKCAENGSIDDATRLEMANFETLSKMFVR